MIPCQHLSNVKGRKSGKKHRNNGTDFNKACLPHRPSQLSRNTGTHTKLGLDTYQGLNFNGGLTYDISEVKVLPFSALKCKPICPYRRYIFWKDSFCLVAVVLIYVPKFCFLQFYDTVNFANICKSRRRQNPAWSPSPRWKPQVSYK
jgi:hypothetical protein